MNRDGEYFLLADQLLVDGVGLTSTREKIEMGERFLATLVDMSSIEQDIYLKSGISVFGFRVEVARARVAELRAERQFAPALEGLIAWVDAWYLRGATPDETEVLAQIQLVAEQLAQFTEMPVRELARQKAVKVLKQLHIQRVESIVEGALAAALNARARPDLDPDPWPDPVVGADLLQELDEAYKKYIICNDDMRMALVLFTVLTHVFDCFDILPVLLVKSPIKRCGKTRVLEIACGLMRRPTPSSNISAAAMYRLIELQQPTLIMDEADSFFTGKYNTPAYEEMRNVINSGHTREFAVVYRVKGKDRDEPTKFSTWCPKVLACIGDLSDTVEDRAIVVTMRRRLREESVTRWRHAHRVKLQPLQRQAARWAADCQEDLRAADPDVPEALNDREQDCWRPLFAIADLAGGEWPRLAREAATSLCGRGEESAVIPPGQQLLQDLQGIFAISKLDELSTAVILAALHDWPESRWKTFHRGHPLTDMELGDLLRPFKVHSKSIKFRVEHQYTAPDGTPTIGYETRVLRGYTLEKLRDAMARYATTPPAADIS